MKAEDKKWLQTTFKEGNIVLEKSTLKKFLVISSRLQKGLRGINLWGVELDFNDYPIGSKVKAKCTIKGLLDKRNHKVLRTNKLLALMLK